MHACKTATPPQPCWNLLSTYITIYWCFGFRTLGLHLSDKTSQTSLSSHTSLSSQSTVPSQTSRRVITDISDCYSSDQLDSPVPDIVTDVASHRPKARCVAAEQAGVLHLLGQVHASEAGDVRRPRLPAVRQHSFSRHPSKIFSVTRTAYRMPERRYTLLHTSFLIILYIIIDTTYVTDTISWRGHHDWVMQLNWIHFCFWGVGHKWVRN